MKVDHLATKDGKVINFESGTLVLKEDGGWNARLQGVGEQNLMFDAVSSKTPMFFTFETENGSYEGRAIVADIDSSRGENIITLESADSLDKQS